jgi:glycosyltransferase involved in cell wall biosynthesis
LNNNPLVTIITPSYNSEKFIEQTILSVLNQTYTNIQYIIIDGLSSDNTVNIIKKFSNKIDHFLSEKDEGMYDALNKGFKLGNGKYFAWINADDFYFNDAIEKSINYMEKKKLQWIVGNPTTLNYKGNIITRNPYYYPNLIIKNGLAFPCFWGYIPQESTIFTKELYLKSGGINKEYRYAGDFDLWKKFANYSNLVTAEIKIGVFRKRINQLSDNQKAYLKEIDKNNCLIPFGKILRLLFSSTVNFIKNFNINKNKLK